MAIQYYIPNQIFQISSLQQLKSVEVNNYTWAGRTLTGWLDSENMVHKISSDAEISTSFTGMTAGISGLWELNKLPIWLSVQTNENDPNGTAGKLSVVWDTGSNTSFYYPLPAPATGSFTLSNLEENTERYYQSNLSLQLVANEGYIPVLFKYQTRNDTWQTVTDPTEILKLSYTSNASKNSLSVVAEFNKGVLTYYSGKNNPSPVL